MDRLARGIDPICLAVDGVMGRQFYKKKVVYITMIIGSCFITLWHCYTYTGRIII